MKKFNELVESVLTEKSDIDAIIKDVMKKYPAGTLSKNPGAKYDVQNDIAAAIRKAAGPKGDNLKFNVLVLGPPTQISINPDDKYTEQFLTKNGLM